MVTVRLSAPERFAGRPVHLEIPLEGDGLAQRKSYLRESTIQFAVTAAAVGKGRVMLSASEIHAAAMAQLH
ncbi:hypothetical protein [Tahibacter amnicola]|uniref:Uncharacterized protein n=1 Tax=Tahibacter amnicola TaxID=2976241 RepID=A0ABY6BPD7_9GAMM|nr:hypothetical protein [Tahibacter amnicola]UXI70270.1 hypothetical protein N4264_11735 [Tahibacter amnicola]